MVEQLIISITIEKSCVLQYHLFKYCHLKFRRVENLLSIKNERITYLVVNGLL